MSELEITQEQIQQLKICPQLLQSMALLQMNVQDLNEYLNRALEENPMLERRESSDDAYRQFVQRYSWLNTNGGEAPPEAGAEDKELHSMDSFLRDQLSRLKLEPKLSALCEYLASLLDDDGRLDEKDLERLAKLGVPQSLADRALEILQSLEPAGIAARSLSECLLLQLRRRGKDTPLLQELVEKHLDKLSKKKYGQLAHELNCQQRDIQDAAGLIAQLDPRPGQQFFQQEEPVRYIVPDAYVLDEGEQLTVMLNDFYLPRLQLSAAYQDMLRDSADAQAAGYLREQLKSARELIGGLDRRGQTLRRCLDEITHEQRAFFLGTQTPLVPLKRRELAERLGVHPSTVTRALSGKYLQCRRGTYPLSYFFSPDVGGASAQEIRARIAQLLTERPSLNDRQLWETLVREGYTVARRTVTKYRLNMGLPTASRRKKI